MAGRDPLKEIFKAAREGDVEEVAYWLDAHPELLETKGLFDARPVLYEAAEYGHAGVVRMLLRKGANVNSENRYRQRPLFTAARGNHTEVMTLLLGAGAELSQRFNSGTRTALMAACSSGSVLSSLAATRLLLQHMRGNGVNERDHFGDTALALACTGANAEVTRALLLAGADPTIADKKGRTPRDIVLCVIHGTEHPCAVVFEWWDGELERAYAIHRARRVHEDSVRQQQAPGAPVPTYLRRAWPQVEVMAKSKGEEAGDGPLDDDGLIIKYAIEELGHELYIELLAGFHK